MIGILGGTPDLQHACSRAACGSEASWAIRWQNPKIHAGDYRKTWLACDAHVEYLRAFLAARSFPLEVLALSDFVGPTSRSERAE